MAGATLRAHVGNAGDDRSFGGAPLAFTLIPGPDPTIRGWGTTDTMHVTISLDEVDVTFTGSPAELATLFARVHGHTLDLVNKAEGRTDEEGRP